MASTISPRVGKIAPPGTLLDVERLLDAYHRVVPDPGDPAQRVAFGTSGHRGCAFASSFNEHHILAIAQAVSEFRARQGTEGPFCLQFCDCRTSLALRPESVGSIERGPALARTDPKRTFVGMPRTMRVQPRDLLLLAALDPRQCTHGLLR